MSGRVIFLLVFVWFVAELAVSLGTNSWEEVEDVDEVDYNG